MGPSAVLIPPSNHPDVMAGQGTIAMEMLEQVIYYDSVYIYFQVALLGEGK